MSKEILKPLSTGDEGGKGEQEGKGDKSRSPPGHAERTPGCQQHGWRHAYCGRIDSRSAESGCKETG